MASDVLLGMAHELLVVSTRDGLAGRIERCLVRAGGDVRSTNVRSVGSVQMADMDLRLGLQVDLVVVDGEPIDDDELQELVATADPVPVLSLADDAGWGPRSVGLRMGLADVVHRDVFDDPVTMCAVIGSVLERSVLRRELEAVRAVADHERELRHLAAAQPLTSVSATMVGRGPVAERSPQYWARLVDEHQRILALAVEQRSYRVEGDPRGDLRALADLLASVQAGPADVTRLHGEAVQRLLAGRGAEARTHLLAEGRMRLLELMGALVARYRAAGRPTGRGTTR